MVMVEERRLDGNGGRKKELWNGRLDGDGGGKNEFRNGSLDGDGGRKETHCLDKVREIENWKWKLKVDKSKSGGILVSIPFLVLIKLDLVMW